MHVSPKSVLITGASGFIGSHLTERCLELGWNVTGIDSFTDYYAEAVKRHNLAGFEDHSGWSFIEGDLLGLDLEPLLRDISVVFHLAAQPGVRASWDQFALYTRANVDATQRLLHAAKEVELSRFVLASSSSIYGNAETFPTGEHVTPRPVSPYGVTKATAEQLAHVYWRTFGVPTVCLRYFTVYGPRQRPDMAFNRLIDRALSGEAFSIFGDGAQTRDFTFVADAVNGTIAAGDCGTPGSAYNIGGGSRRSMNDVLDTLSGIMGRIVERCYLEQQLGDARDTAADIGLARRDLGYEPGTDFVAGLAAQLDWQRKLVSVRS